MNVQVVARNRKAFHDFHIEEKIEAGIALTGTEVKSVRAGRVSLADSHALVERGEVWLYNLHIAPYDHGNRYNHEPTRPRKLLLHKQQIAHLLGRVRQRGYTLVPLQIYIKGDWVKVELAVARGKKVYDKRRDIAARDAERRIQRALRGRDAS